MLTAYDPPAYMTDFNEIPGQLASWSRAVSGWFDESIALQHAVLRGQPCQYYNQLTTPTVGRSSSRRSCGTASGNAA